MVYLLIISGVFSFALAIYIGIHFGRIENNKLVKDQLYQLNQSNQVTSQRNSNKNFGVRSRKLRRSHMFKSKTLSSFGKYSKPTIA